MKVTSFEYDRFWSCKLTSAVSGTTITLLDQTSRMSSILFAVVTGTILFVCSCGRLFPQYCSSSRGFPQLLWGGGGNALKENAHFLAISFILCQICCVQVFNCKLIIKSIRKGSWKLIRKEPVNCVFCNGC